MTASDERVAFVSYASENREEAETVCASLEERGLTCWIAPRDVRAGREYADEIIRGIERSASVVLVLSEAANTSVFVRREIERAVSKQKPVFPIRIEEVTPSPGLELFVSGTHWIDAWTGRWTDHMDRLARDLTDGAARTPTPATSAARHASLEHRSFTKVFVAAGVVLVAAVSGLAIWSSSRATLQSPQRMEAPVLGDRVSSHSVERGSPPIVEAQPQRAQAPAATTTGSTRSVMQETSTHRPQRSRSGEASRAVTSDGRVPAGASSSAAENTRELNELRDVYDDLSTRGGAVDEALNQLWEGMKPLSPRVDMVTHQRSLRTNLTRSKDALEAKHAAGARRYLDIARGDLEALEQFLNR